MNDPIKSVVIADSRALAQIHAAKLMAALDRASPLLIIVDESKEPPSFETEYQLEPYDPPPEVRKNDHRPRRSVEFRAHKNAHNHKKRAR
jgi:hypothetical protein